jgi:hypothetical protein
MNYKEAFAVNEISFNKLTQDQTNSSHKYQLNNFDHYEPKLVEDFYLKYFTHDLLFGTDILELKEFLEYHFDYCDVPEKYYSILDNKVIPKIHEIIDNALGTLGGGYFEEKKLEHGFVESQGVIHKWEYDYRYMLNYVGWGKSQNDLKKRIQIIQVFIEEYKGTRQTKPLKWVAGPSQLGVIISELIEKGYMEADKYRGEVNNAKLSRELFKAFSINGCDSPKSLEIYLSSGNKKNTSAKTVFNDRGLNIPPVDFT